MSTRYLAEYVSGGASNATAVAPLATATADAIVPSVQTTGSVTIVALLATATAAANTPTVRITVVSVLATSTGAANVPVPKVTVGSALAAATAATVATPTVVLLETQVVELEQVFERSRLNRSASSSRPRPSFIAGGRAGSHRIWSVDLQGPNGGANTLTDAPFRTCRITWTVEGPGSIEFELHPECSTDWTPGLHRVVVHGPVDFAGYVTNLSRSGKPRELDYRAAGLGLASILDYRLVRHDTTLNDRAAVLVEFLLDEAQAQINGDMNFRMGAVHGPTVVRLRNYCFGIVIGDAIRELASIARGFDWEIDAAGRLNIWNGDRGRNTGIDLYETDDIQDWEVELDTSELITTVSAVGDPSDPFGPRHEGVAAGFADDYGRREIAIDVDTNDLDELIDAAEAELKADGGARITLKTMWVDDRGPWSLGDVWLQDIVRVHLEDCFGGLTRMRCVDVSVTLDPLPQRYFIEHTFQALVEDITVESEES